MDVTGIANIATMMSQAKVLNEAGMAVMSMTIDDMKQEGADVAQLMASAPSIDPNIGGNIDVSV